MTKKKFNLYCFLRLIVLITIVIITVLYFNETHAVERRIESRSRSVNTKVVSILRTFLGQIIYDKRLLG